MLPAFSSCIDPVTIKCNDDEVGNKNEIIFKYELIVHEQPLDVMILFSQVNRAWIVTTAR